MPTGRNNRQADAPIDLPAMDGPRLDRVRALLQNAARQLVGADGITVVLRDGDHCLYLEEDAIAPLWKGRRFPMRECISGWVMMNASPVVIPDVLNDARIPTAVYSPTFVRSMAMVPIGHERPVGAVGAYWAAVDYQATPSQLETLGAIADSAALALQSE